MNEEGIGPNDKYKDEKTKHKVEAQAASGLEFWGNGRGSSECPRIWGRSFTLDGYALQR